MPMQSVVQNYSDGSFGSPAKCRISTYQIVYWVHLLEFCTNICCLAVTATNSFAGLVRLGLMDIRPKAHQHGNVYVLSICWAPVRPWGRA